MKYQVNNYVEAFVGALGETPKDKRGVLVSNFVRLLHRTGDIRSENKITEAVHKKIVNNEGGRWVNIEAARELKESDRKLLINKFSEKDHVDFKINPELVAGVRITVDGEEELDNSLNQKLNKLFK